MAETGKGTLTAYNPALALPATVLPHGADTSVPCAVDEATRETLGASPSLPMLCTVELRTPRPPMVTSVEVPS